MKTAKRTLWGETLCVRADDPNEIFVGRWYNVKYRQRVKIPFPLPVVVYRVDDEKGFVYVRDLNNNRHLLAKADFMFRRSRQPKGEKKP